MRSHKDLQEVLESPEQLKQALRETQGGVLHQLQAAGLPVEIDVLLGEAYHPFSLPWMAQQKLTPEQSAQMDFRLRTEPPPPTLEPVQVSTEPEWREALAQGALWDAQNVFQVSWLNRAAAEFKDYKREASRESYRSFWECCQAWSVEDLLQLSDEILSQAPDDFFSFLPKGCWMRVCVFASIS